MKDFFNELRQKPHVERLRFLEANADDLKNGSYYRPFSEEEIQELKELNTSNDLEIRALETEMARLLEPIKEKLKNLRAAKKHTLTNIVEGRQMHTGDYYIFNDEEERKTYHISPQGDVIWEGPMTTYQRTLDGEKMITARYANAK